MLARLIEVGIRPEKKQEIVTILQHELVPLLHRQQGFVSYEFGIRETDSSTAVAATCWDNRQQADTFYATSAYTNIIKRLKPFFTAEIKPVFYTVEISTAHRVAFGKAA